MLQEAVARNVSCGRLHKVDLAARDEYNCGTRLDERCFVIVDVD